MKTEGGAVCGRIWGKRPLFCVAVAMVVALLCESWGAGLGWVVGLVFGASVGWLVSWRAGFLGVGLVWLGMLSFWWHEERYEAGQAWVMKRESGMVEGRLLEDAKGGEGGYWSAAARLHGTGFPGVKVLWIGAGEGPVAGTELQAMGVFGPLEGPRNPGALREDVMQRAEGVVGIFRASEMRERKWTGPVAERLARVRKGFRESIVRGLDENGTAAVVIRAVVLGERSPDSLELIARFRDSGTLHVFTVSGLHVAMVGGLLWVFLKLVRCPRRWAVPILIAMMFGYVWLAGSGPAAMRSAWMGAVFLMAFLLRRRTDLLNSLGVVLVGSILWNPAILWLPGVQLSYGVVAAIGMWSGLARRWFECIAQEDSFLPKSETGVRDRVWSGFRRKLAEGLSVSLAATLGSTPLGMFHFGIVTPISVFATVALVPLVYVLLGVALVSAVVDPVLPSVSSLLNRGNAKVAELCSGTAGWFAEIPGAYARTTSVKEEVLVIYDLEYGADGACFAMPGRPALMIDCGGESGIEGEVGFSVRNLGMIPDSVIFTHADSKHVGSVKTFREMFPLRQAMVGMGRKQGPLAAGWHGARGGDLNVVFPGTGSFFEVGDGVRVEVLISPHDVELGSEADDRALVMMLHWRGWRILWLGDAGRLSEMWLVENGVDVKADLIVAGCHETDLSLVDPFLKAVDAQAVIVPRLPGGEMDAMRAQRTGMLQKRKMKVIDQKVTGGLTVTLRDGELVIRGFVDGSETRLRGRR